MMKPKKYCLLTLSLMIFAFAPAAFAQEHELALLIARLKPSDRSLDSVGQVKAAFDGSVAYQINYANRMVNGELASLHWELAITGAPRTGVKSSNVLLPRTYSTLIFTPGLKLKIFPGGGFSPYLVSGVGLGRFSQSGTNINGSPNTGDRSNTSFVFNYGGGVDMNLLGPISVRGEVRDFMTGTPSFSTPFLNDRQHNLFVGVGIVVRWK